MVRPIGLGSGRVAVWIERSEDACPSPWVSRSFNDTPVFPWPPLTRGNPGPRNQPGSLRGRLDGREECSIRITPGPFFARLDRAHQRVTSRLEVGSSVSLPRAVAAPDRAAGQAHPQVHPAIASLLAGRAYQRARPDVADRREVRALAAGPGALERETTHGVSELITHLRYSTKAIWVPSGDHRLPSF
jgi:hypothetical protein